MIQALAAVLRYYPFYSGAFRLANSRIVTSLTKHDVGAQWCRTAAGEILVPLEDMVGRTIFLTGDYDRKITTICRKIILPGDIAIDVGANLGIVTLAMAKAVGRSGIVHAFEPNPIIRSYLSQSLTRNHYQNVTLHESALGSDKTTLTLHVPRSNMGQGSLFYHAGRTDIDTYECRVERLSDLVGRDPIRLIKIDVEGFEAQVLAGASRILRDIRPVVLLETNDHDGIRFHERPAISELLKYKYEFLAIRKSLLSVRLDKITAGCAVSPSHDIVAVPSDKYQSLQTLLA